MDAMYISSNVSLAQHLLNAAFHYNTRIVLSEDYFKMLSIEVKKEVRRIDRVKFPDFDPTPF